jgi:L-malate glycosyltransferase
MRIALCADGRSPHTVRWANAVADRGLEVVVVWLGHELDGADLSVFRTSITHAAHRPPSPRRPWRLPIDLPEPHRIARRLQPDVAHGLFLQVYGWTAAALGVHPLVLTALGSDVFSLRTRGAGLIADRLAERYQLWRTRAAVRAADVVLADSAPLAAIVREEFPTTETRIVRFGVETNPSPASARERWRRRLAIADDAFVILSMRLVRPHYNIDTIIRALPLIREVIPKTVFILKVYEAFSDPEYRRFCLDLAQSLGVRDALREVGELERSELLELHAASDVHVSVPTTDGTAVSVLEAMAAGVPVVASDVPGIDPVILRHGDTAILVPPRDTAALAHAITALGGDVERRRKVAEHARQVVRSYADFDREMDRAVLLYEELVSSRVRKVSSTSGSGKAARSRV